jgi:hypothetical protein
MIKIEVSPTSILVPVQWEDARPLVNCRKTHAKTQRRKEERGRVGPQQQRENAWLEAAEN